MNRATCSRVENAGIADRLRHLPFSSFHRASSSTQPYFSSSPRGHGSHRGISIFMMRVPLKMPQDMWRLPAPNSTVGVELDKMGHRSTFSLEKDDIQNRGMDATPTF